MQQESWSGVKCVTDSGPLSWVCHCHRLQYLNLRRFKMQREMFTNAATQTAFDSNWVSSKVIPFPALSSIKCFVRPRILWEGKSLRWGCLYSDAGLIDTQLPEIRRSAVYRVPSDSGVAEGLLGKLNKSRAQLSRRPQRQGYDLTVSAAAMGWERERGQTPLHHRGKPMQMLAPNRWQANPRHWAIISVVHHPLSTAGCRFRRLDWQNMSNTPPPAHKWCQWIPEWGHHQHLGLSAPILSSHRQSCQLCSYLRI